MNQTEVAAPENTSFKQPLPSLQTRPLPAPVSKHLCYSSFNCVDSLETTFGSNHVATNTLTVDENIKRDFNICLPPPATDILGLSLANPNDSGRNFNYFKIVSNLGFKKN